MFSFKCAVCGERKFSSAMWHCPGCAKLVCEGCLPGREVTECSGWEFHFHCGEAALEYVEVVRRLPEKLDCSRPGGP